MRKNHWNTAKPYIREAWRLSLPAILTQITTILMQYIDAAMVGALGANASAAIGLVSTSTWLLGGVTYAVAAGFSVQVAHQIGARNEAGARNIVRHGLLAALAVSALLCAAGCAASGPLPVWLGGKAVIRADASSYFLTFALMLPFSQLNLLSASFLQCCGDMVTPSVLNAAMCALDVAFNALLIPRLGVLGAGLGTALACACVSIVMCWRCCGCNAQLRLRRTDTRRFDAQILKKALRIGVPVAVQEIAMNSAQVVATMIVAPLGVTAIAANSFAVTAEALCYMPGHGVEQAAATLVGRCVGAGEAQRARRYAGICTAMGALLMALTGLVMYALCPALFRIMTPDGAVQTLAARVLRIGLLAEPLFGAAMVAAGSLRGAGDTLVPGLLNLGSIWVIRLGLSLLLVGPMGLCGIWLAMAVELCIRGLLMLARLRTSRYFALYAPAKDEIL